MQDEAARSGSMMETVKSVWGRRKWRYHHFTCRSWRRWLIIFMPGVYGRPRRPWTTKGHERMVNRGHEPLRHAAAHTAGDPEPLAARAPKAVRSLSRPAHARSSEEVIESRARTSGRAQVDEKGRRRGATISSRSATTGRDPPPVARVTNTLDCSIEEKSQGPRAEAAGTPVFEGSSPSEEAAGDQRRS